MLKKTIIILSIVLVLVSTASAAENHTEIRNDLTEAEKAIQEMENSNIPAERVESLLSTANQSFQAQKNLAENQDAEPDFSRTRELTSQIKDIKETALRVNDRINSLEERIEELEDQDLNLSGVKTAFNELNQTFHNQRFEEAEGQVENVYSEISDAKSIQTQVQAFTSAQRQNIIVLYQQSANYAANNWIKLSLTSIIFIALSAVFLKEYRLWKLESRRENLIEKKQVIEDMIEQAQQEYYVKGKGSKIAFRTRTEKFQEMKRDTEQDINEIESRLESIKGLPVISPEIKERSNEFQARGKVMEETGEIKGSLERINDRRQSETSERYRKILKKDIVDEAKDEIKGLEDPDYRALLEIESQNKDRKTLKEFLKDRVEIDLDDVETTDDQIELLKNETVGEARDQIEGLENPDYRALLKAEMQGKNRKTLKEYLKEQIRFD